MFNKFIYALETFRYPRLPRNGFYQGMRICVGGIRNTFLEAISLCHSC